MEQHEALAIYSAVHQGAVVKAKTVDPGQAWDFLVEYPGEAAAEYVGETRETLLEYEAMHGVCQEIVRKFSARS